jgi:SAM-dependent methyltransferase
MRQLIAAINARRIDAHYEATLSDPAVAAEWIRHYLDGLGAGAGTRVLDYGCGRGRVSAMLRQRGCSVVGADIHAHSWWKHVKGAAFVLTSTTPREAPFLDAAFDLVLNIDSTHYYDAAGLRQHAAQMYRVLRRGGHWIIVQANPEGYGASLTQVASAGRLHRLAQARESGEAAGFAEIDHWFEGLAAPIAPLFYMRLRHVLRPWPLYMNDHGSWAERLLPPRRRHRWVLRMQKPAG